MEQLRELLPSDLDEDLDAADPAAPGAEPAEALDEAAGDQPEKGQPQKGQPEKVGGEAS